MISRRSVLTLSIMGIVLPAGVAFVLEKQWPDSFSGLPTIVVLASTAIVFLLQLRETRRQGEILQTDRVERSRPRISYDLTGEEHRGLGTTAFTVTNHGHEDAEVLFYFTLSFQIENRAVRCSAHGLYGGEEPWHIPVGQSVGQRFSLRNLVGEIEGVPPPDVETFLFATNRDRRIDLTVEAKGRAKSDEDGDWASLGQRRWYRILSRRDWILNPSSGG